MSSAERLQLMEIGTKYPDLIPALTELCFIFKGFTWVIKDPLVIRCLADREAAQE